MRNLPSRQPNPREGVSTPSLISLDDASNQLATQSSFSTLPGQRATQDCLKFTPEIATPRTK